MRFISKLSVLALAVAGMVTTFGAQAQSIDVRVIGTITPAACTPTMAGGGVVDYGNIAASTLNMTRVNALPERTVAFSVACDAPTRVALRSVDNRAASRVPGIVTTGVAAGLGDWANFGLGTVSGANVGGYVMRLTNFTADGVNVFPVINGANGADASWIAGVQGALSHTANFLNSVSATAGGRPVAFSTLSGTLAVQAVLNRGDALPLTAEVPLDGMATLELVYL